MPARPPHLITLQQVCRHCILWCAVICLVLLVLLLVHGDGLLHQRLLLVALLGKHLTLQPTQAAQVMGAIQKVSMCILIEASLRYP